MSAAGAGDPFFLLMLMYVLLLGAAVLVIGARNRSRIAQTAGLLIIGIVIWMGGSALDWRFL